MIRRQRKGDKVRVTFVLPDTAEYGRVSVVGDFNDWTPDAHRLIRRANGTRSTVVTIPAGSEHRFRYLAEGGCWFDDPDADDRVGQDGVVRV
jgi:1,4-alpha-glucan branching enzyme